MPSMSEFGAQTINPSEDVGPIIQPRYSSNEPLKLTPIRHTSNQHQDITIGGYEKSSFISQGISIQPGHQGIKNIYDKFMNNVYKGQEPEDSPLQNYHINNAS